MLQAKITRNLQGRSDWLNCRTGINPTTALLHTENFGHKAGFPQRGFDSAKIGNNSIYGNKYVEM